MAPQTRSKSKASSAKEGGGGSSNNDSRGGDKTTSSTSSFSVSELTQLWKKYGNVSFGKRVLLDPEYTWIVATFLFCCEVFINGFIILGRQCKFPPLSSKVISNNSYEQIFN